MHLEKNKTGMFTHGLVPDTVANASIWQIQNIWKVSKTYLLVLYVYLKIIF